MMVDGERQWIEFQSTDGDSDRFPDIGEAFEQAHPEAVILGDIGQAKSRLIDMKPLIEFGLEWLKEHPVEE